MLHEIGLELASWLKSAGVPFAVVDGPEPTATTTFGRERIVIEHDGSDAFTPVRSQHINPKHRRTRQISAKLTIYAQSSATGALGFEHRRRAEHVLDAVLVAMDRVAAARRNAWEPTSGHFIEAVDLEKSERPGGAVYELSFTFNRAVEVRTWVGAAQPEATLGAGGMTSITRVSRAHAPGDDDDDTETACGA